MRTGEKVNGIKKDADGHFLISTTADHTYLSKTLLLAMGNGILDPKPTPFFTNEGELLENVHVSITEFEEMKGRRILISGGGNSAVDWANAFAPIAEEVILVYRKEHLKGHEAEVEKVLCGPVTCRLQADLIAKTFDASGTRIDSVTIRDQKTGEEETLSVDDVIVCHGFNRENELFDQNEVGLEVFDEYYVEATPQTETAVPGLFVLGDAAKYPGKVHLIAGAFHDAVNAVNEAKTYIDPQANRMGTVSTYDDKLKPKVSTAWEQYTST
ncbi:MAG: NAD(P)/FAD-dependent oxidoreductase [Alkalibacterium sp.]|nr:NAD(P)/FAD-dependent oxidoreductase [Alkalibacterium sp.]